MGNKPSEKLTDQQQKEQKEQFKKIFNLNDDDQLKDTQEQDMTETLQYEKYSFQIREQIPLLEWQAKIVFQYLLRNDDNMVRPQDASKFFPQLRNDQANLTQDSFIRRCQFDDKMTPQIMKNSELIKRCYKDRKKFLLKENELNGLISKYQTKQQNNQVAQHFQIQGENNAIPQDFIQFVSMILLKYNIQNNAQGDGQQVELLPDNHNQKVFDVTEILEQVHQNENLITKQQAEYIYYNHLYKTDWNKMFKDIEYVCEQQQLVKSQLLFTEEEYDICIPQYATKLAETIIRQSKETYNKFYKIDDILPLENNIPIEMQQAMKEIYGYDKINAKQLRELQIYF